MGSLVTQYVYDAWGNIISVSGNLATTIGKLNSLRYRGYYYDRETECYYLQSRYYNPTLCRFINADGAKCIGKSENSLGTNAFAYCENCVINFIDVNGNFLFMIIPKSSKIKVTIITPNVKEFKIIAKVIKNNIKKKYISSVETVYIKDGNANSFKNAWNKLGKNDFVVIATHGTANDINGFKKFNQLKYKEIKGLICVACHAAHGGEKNILIAVISFIIEHLV